MKIKGLKKACSETKCLNNNGAVEIAIDLNTGELHSTFFVGFNESWSVWYDTDIVNVLYLREYASMNEIYHMLSCVLPEIFYGRDMELPKWFKES